MRDESDRPPDNAGLVVLTVTPGPEPAGVGQPGLSDRAMDGVFGAALAAGLCTIALLFGALFFWSHQVDAAERVREVQLIQNGIESRKQAIEDSLTSVTQWDEAVAHIDGKFDKAWVNTNIGVFLDQSLHMDGAVLLDASDAPIYAASHGVQAPATALPDIVSAAGPLVRAVRQLEAARGLFAARPGSSKVISTPIRSSAVMVLDGKPVLLTATLVQPDFGTALPRGPRSAILISGVGYDAAFKLLSNDYLLERPGLLVGAPDIGPLEARAWLRAPDGRPLASVVWAPQRPGQRLLRSALPQVTMATLGLGLGLLLAMGVLRVNLRSLRRTMGALVVARDAAERASQAKSQFLATMGHELRTPLNGVLGMAEALARARLTRVQRERVGVIRLSGEALLSLLDDLLDFSTLQDDAVAPEVVAFDLEQLVRSVAAAYQPLAEKAGLSFELEVAPDVGGHYQGDTARIRRILRNLCGNAVKFTPGGSVSIRVEGDAGQVIFRVTDTGIGIGRDHLVQLFDGFFQVDATLARRYGGAGMGLAVCRKLAAQMGGVIEVASEPGQGSTFTFRLPLERAAPADPAPEQIDGAERLKVLAAEDNATNRLVLTTMLAEAGIAPTVVQNGREALAAWTDQTWDIILMDIQMPDMNGIEATRAIRQRELQSGRPRTPIVAVTANAMTHQLAEYYAAGMDAVVSKPISMTELLGAMERALARVDAEVKDPPAAPDQIALRIA